MSKERPSTEIGVQRYGWVCLLLALSFLYNPFLMAAASGKGLNVRHSASHRATVGVSELQQLAPMGDERTHLFTHFAVIKVFVALPEVSSGIFLPGAKQPLAPQKLFCSNLWFRPPPAL
ncbi:MAG TPA: hypothetical protein VE077_00480 [Candidatus Methylomirabilis sp.]|nr:hypothetical protein [Candidatus Methylomirabilis sp.]